MLVLVVIQNIGRNTIYIFGSGSIENVGASFCTNKVQKSGLCHEYKVRNLIENNLHVNGMCDTCTLNWYIISYTSHM